MDERGSRRAARAWARFRRHRAAWVSGVVMAVLLLAVLTQTWWWPRGPEELSEAQFAPPSRAHWLGTDANGRDVLARVGAGARVSLVVGLAGAAVSLVIGVGWGGMAGYLGGRWDGVLMRVVDVLYSLPSVIFIIVLVTTLQDGVTAWLGRWMGRWGAEQAPLVMLVVGLGSISWLTMARIVRAQVIALRGRAFVEASRALGAGHVRVLFGHILPNTAGVIIVYLMLTVPAVILGESFLSYLGLGIQPPQASLGSLLAEGAGQINPLRSSWWLLAGPGGLLVVLLVAMGLLGDGLRDALDPEGGG